MTWGSASVPPVLRILEPNDSSIRLLDRDRNEQDLLLACKPGEGLVVLEYRLIPIVVANHIVHPLSDCYPYLAFTRYLFYRKPNGPLWYL